jgi:hypothetical protein
MLVQMMLLLSILLSIVEIATPATKLDAITNKLSHQQVSGKAGAVFVVQRWQELCYARFV